MIERLRQEPLVHNPLVDVSFLFIVMVPLAYADVSRLGILSMAAVSYFSFIYWQMEGYKDVEKETSKPDFMKTEHEKVMDTEPINGSDSPYEELNDTLERMTSEPNRDEEYWSDPANHQTRTEPINEGSWEYEQLQEMRETIEERRQRRREELEERQEAMMRGIEDNDEINDWY